MSRIARIALILAIAFGLAACTSRSSDAERERAEQSAAEAREAGQRAGEEARDAAGKAREAGQRAGEEARDVGRKIGEKARELEVRTRDERAQLASRARKAGEELKRDTRELARNAGAAAAGAREGWKEGEKESAAAVNINAASAGEIAKATGLSSSEAQKLVASRPYSSKRELVSKGVLSEEKYNEIESMLTTK